MKNLIISKKIFKASLIDVILNTTWTLLGNIRPLEEGCEQLRWWDIKCYFLNYRGCQTVQFPGLSLVDSGQYCAVIGQFDHVSYRPNCEGGTLQNIIILCDWSLVWGQYLVIDHKSPPRLTIFSLRTLLSEHILLVDNSPRTRTRHEWRMNERSGASCPIITCSHTSERTSVLLPSNNNTKLISLTGYSSNMRVCWWYWRIMDF